MSFSVTQVARQPGPPAPSAYSAHEINKGHPNLAATPPGHASSPGLSQAPYPSGQNAAPATLVYPQTPQTMNTQPQTRSPFFQRPQLQPSRAAIQNSSPSIRPGAQTPTAVYQTNQHIMMVNHLPMPYPMPQGPQYCIPQYRHSGPPYVGPPQQYPVQPPGPGPFYPGPGPGEFPNAYGTPFYPSQPVYQSAPIIVPTQQQQQQPPPAKREKKTIRIRDPNQGGKDITEEIMSGGGSRNPTPPTVRPTPTPTPPQQLSSQVPEHSPVVYGTVENTHLAASTSVTATSDPKQEEKPKPDPVLKSPSPVLRPEPSGEKKDQAGQTSEAASVESPPELPLAASPVPLAPIAVVAAAVAVSSKSAFRADSEERCELTSPKEETIPISNATPCTEESDLSPTEEADADTCKEPSTVATSYIPVTASTNRINEINGVNEKVTAADGIAEIVQQEVAPLTVELEILEGFPAEVESVPSSIALSTSPSPPLTPPIPVSAAVTTTTPPSSPPPPPISLPAVQGDLHGEESRRTTLNKVVKDTQNKEEVEADGQPEENSESENLNSRKNPVAAQTAVAAPKMWKKPKDRTQAAEEVLEAETERKAEEELSGDKVPESEQDKMSHGFHLERDTSELKKAKVVEENGEQEAEPLRNGAECVSEREEPDANSGSTESSGEGLVYQYKPEQWKPMNPEGKKQYDREFLLDFQFMPACIQKPEGLPPISDVVLDKINQPKLPIRTLDPRILPRGPDFTPAFADFGRQTSGGRGVAVSMNYLQACTTDLNWVFPLRVIIRGILDIAKEIWEEEPNKGRNIIEHVKQMRDRIARVTPIVREHLEKAREAQRTHYNRQAKVRQFQPGDRVMVLVPTSLRCHKYSCSFCGYRLHGCYSETSFKEVLIDFVGFVGVQRVDEGGWNTVQGTKNSRVLDPTKFLKITKVSINGLKSLRPSATSLNRFSALQLPVSSVSSSVSSELDSRRALTSRGSTGREKNDKPLPSSVTRPNTFLRGSSNKELLLDNQAQEEQRREMLETVKQLTGGMDMERNITETDRNKAKEIAKPETPTAPVQDKSSLSEEEMERKCKSIIDEFLHINDYKEAMQCMEELHAQSLLPIFVRVGVESTLERSQITRDHMGQLLYQLVQSEKLSKQDFFKGFSDTLELADDMAIDIPHIWLYLAELVTPMLKEGGISMRELIIEFSKPLLPVGRAGVLLSEILHLLCKQMSHKKVGALWREAGLSWKDYLPEGEDVHTFLIEHKLDFTVSDCSSSSEALSEEELSADELNKQLEKLIIEDKANDEQIFDWVEANLDEGQMSSPTFLRALMTAVCKAAIIADSSSFRVDTAVIKQRVPILLKYLDSDTEKELQALYALQASIVKLDQPPNLLRMFFDCLYDEEVISEDAFYKWESSKDPGEQNGKGVALKSVTAFFTWLREAEEESEDN
uniref:Eukaryotic translation initiation factor 4 gamma 3 n=1 Tax=Chrysemys picta bellii TaxID=8478 RepID=A0A8C3FTD8_CHRPI